MIVAHNPDLEWAVRVLSGRSVGFATATAVLLSIATDGPWSRAADLAGEWAIRGVVHPKEI